MQDIEIAEKAFEDLRTAFEHNGYETERYLDTEHGKVIWFSADTPPVDGEPDDEEPEWVHEAYQKRMRVWKDGNGRFLEVPPGDLSDRVEDMERFLSKHADTHLREQFERGGKSRARLEAFERALERDAAQRHRWRKFRKERTCERIRDWLELQGYRLVQNGQTSSP